MIIVIPVWIILGLKIVGGLIIGFLAILGVAFLFYIKDLKLWY